MNIRNLVILFLVISCFTPNVLSGQVEDSTGKAASQISISTILQEDFNKLKEKEFPEFRLTLLNGEELDSETLRGKPSLINFWFINCAPCIDEMPVLNEVRSHFGQKINFVSITFQSQEEVAAFLKKYDFDFVHIVDARDFIKSTGLITYPKTILLDKELTVVEIEKPLPKADPATGIRNTEHFKSRIVENLSALLDQ